MEEKEEQSKGIQVVLFPLPFQGHINPMLQLANILHSRGGFSITVIHTEFNSPNPANYPNFTFIPIKDGLSETEASTTDIMSLLSILNLNCVVPFRDCLGRLLADSNSEEHEAIGCLISDVLFHFSRAVADCFELPRIALWTTSASCFLAILAIPSLLERGYLPINQGTQMEDPVPELPPLRFKDLPITEKQNPELFYQLAQDMIRETKISSALIYNTFEELEQPELVRHGQDFPIPVLPIGPFHRYFPASSSSLLTQDPTCISWLDKQAPNSVIYVSFGSLATLEEKEFLEVAWGLANSRQHFLWVVRPGLIHGSQKWLESLPIGFIEMLGGRGHIVKWAPQQEVLAHNAVAAFWTHNGWNSTLESICEGVPMICYPCFGDQNVNSRYVSQVWRVGLQLENGLHRGEIQNVITKVMMEREGEEMRERIMDLKQKVQHCLKQGGSSYESLENLIHYISKF